MAAVRVPTLADYEAHLDATVAKWTPQQRTALAAGMAERWLPAYEAFSKREDWGDPESLRRTLDAVWDHVTGRPLVPLDRARHLRLLEDSTPHMDDLDAPEALSACVMIHDALECCGTDRSESAAVDAVLSGFAAALPEWIFDEEEQPRLWKQLAARSERAKQEKLMGRIGATSRFDRAAVEALRAALRTPEFAGEVAARTEAEESPGLTNQAAFEQYRRLLESSLRRPSWRPPEQTAFMVAMSNFCEWGVRYLHRLRTISGKHGRLADTAAQQALIARARARDAQDPAVPAWDPTVLQVMAINLGNPYSEYDVKSLDQPHGYGPSLRGLWSDARCRGLSDDEAWQSVVAWAHHRPAAWEAEDRRKKRGRAQAAPELVDRLARAVAWSATGDLDFPWAAEVDGPRWRVRLNDFPDAVMYTLLVDDQEIGDFHDWPGAWKRE